MRNSRNFAAVWPVMCNAHAAAARSLARRHRHLPKPVVYRQQEAACTRLEDLCKQATAGPIQLKDMLAHCSPSLPGSGRKPLSAKLEFAVEAYWMMWQPGLSSEASNLWCK